jgi:hypothetical protein
MIYLMVMQVASRSTRRWRMSGLLVATSTAFHLMSQEKCIGTKFKVEEILVIGVTAWKDNL